MSDEYSCWTENWVWFDQKSTHWTDFIYYSSWITWPCTTRGESERKYGSNCYYAWSIWIFYRKHLASGQTRTDVYGLDGWQISSLMWSCNRLHHSRETCFILHSHLHVHGRGGNTRGGSSVRSSGRGIHYSAHHTKSEEHVDSAASTKGMSAIELTR